MPKKSAYRLSSSRAPAVKKKMPWVKIAIVLAILITVLAILELTNTTHILHKKKVPAIIPSTSSNSNSPAPASGRTPKTDNSSPDSTQPPSSKNTLPSGSGNNLALVAPYGDFVSNHHPGGGNPTQEVSICNTTPGANCYIKITSSSSGQVTKLSTELVGSDGSARWDWDANTLTSGSWQVSAVASLNGQVKTSIDTALLEIP
jgi:hypothetical protein